MIETTHGELVVGEPATVVAEAHASTARGPWLELLRAYGDIYRLIDALPCVVWQRATRRRFARHLRVPRLRWVVRALVSIHCRRSIAALRRGGYAAVVLEEQPSVTRADIALLEDFRESVPDVPLRRVAFFAVVAGLLLAYLMAHTIHAHNINTRFLGNFTKAIIELDRHGAVTAVQNISVAGLLGSLCLSLWAIGLLLAPTAMAFRLKRTAFNIRPLSTRDLADTAVREHVEFSSGVYLLERRAFVTVGLTPPQEVALDLWEWMILVASLAVIGVGVAAQDINGESIPTGVVFVVLALWVGRRNVRRAVRRRESRGTCAIRPDKGHRVGEVG